MYQWDFTSPVHKNTNIMNVCVHADIDAGGREGIYKDMSAHLTTMAVFNAELFASRGQMEVLLGHKNGKREASKLEGLCLLLGSFRSNLSCCMSIGSSLGDCHRSIISQQVSNCFGSLSCMVVLLSGCFM